MLEGKEIQGNIGSVGEYSVDLEKTGVLTLSVSAKVDLIAELEKLAAKTNTPIDDQAIAWVKKVIGLL